MVIKKETLTFLKQLKKNNLKSWVDEHRDACDAAKTNFTEVAKWLIHEVAEFDGLVAHARLSPARSTSRLNRDTRFHQGLPSYKSEILCVANFRGRKGTSAGYFIRISADGCAVGGGVYEPRAPDLRRYRERVSEHYHGLIKILRRPAFKRDCPSGLYTAGQLKKVPATFDPEDPAADLLRLKHFTTYEPMSDRVATSTAGETAMRNVLKQSHALVTFLNGRD